MRRVTCADGVAKLAHDGHRRRSLLHDCYTVYLDMVDTGRYTDHETLESGTLTYCFKINHAEMPLERQRYSWLPVDAPVITAGGS
jgi:hypothetical protein